MPQAHATGSPTPASRHSQARFALFAWGVLAYNLAVVLWGAYVRSTGSGAGCGNHWPLCNGAITPRSPATATIIEFTHRVMSGLDLLLVAALLVWAFRAFPRRHSVRLAATFSAVFLVTEALLGAALVLLEHVARNASVSRAYSLSAHLTNTLTLLAFLTLTAWWASGRPFPRVGGPRAGLAALSLGVVLLMGISGAIAALGDTLFPAQSLAAGFAQDFDPAANIFLRLRLWHPVIAVAGSAWLLFFAALCARRMPDAAGIARAMGAFVLIQVAAGIANVLLLAPVWMQILHLLLADLVWIALVLLSASVLAGKREA
jgi:heme A synthase